MNTGIKPEEPPYLTTDEKRKVQAMIPPELANNLFYKLLPCRGAQNAVIQILLTKFHDALVSAGANRDLNMRENEAIAIAVLGNITFNHEQK